VKRGQDSPEYIRNRRKLQRQKRRYMELRDILQVAGEIPIELSGAIRDERVDPAQQTNNSELLPTLVKTAIRNGWNVPNEKKPRYVDEMGTILDDPEAKQKDKIAAFNALRMADKDQYERDNPEKTKSNSPTVLNVVEVVVNSGDSKQDSTIVPETVPLPPK